MYNLYNHGYENNRQKVKELNRQIRSLEDSLNLDNVNKAFDGLSQFYEDQGRPDDAKDMQSAKKNIYFNYNQMMAKSDEGKYIKVNVEPPKSAFEQTVQSLTSLPVDYFNYCRFDPVSGFFFGLNLLGQAIEGKDWDPKASLKEGDVRIYVSPDYNPSFKAKGRTASQYNFYGQYGIEYAFSGSDLIYYQENEFSDVVWAH